MTDTANRLDQLMREQLPEGGYVVPGGRALFMEVIDTATGEVWMSAAPVQQTAPALPGGPMEISVNKAHVVGFGAGRSVTLLSLPEGDFVEIVGDDADDGTLVLPEGGTLKRIELERPWVVSLPNPTKAFFWLNKSMRSFQGPVALPG
tara:strand:+ start:3246 stop:3689 length:444 start_codon:yes stop_codon:yes gene_type:complete